MTGLAENGIQTSPGVKERRQNKVSTCVSDEAMRKLEEICREIDRPKSWVISRLILAANVDLLRGTYGGGSE